MCFIIIIDSAAAVAKLLQSCLTLCNPIDSSPLGPSVPGILQARVLEWGAIAFSDNKWIVVNNKEGSFNLQSSKWSILTSNFNFIYNIESFENILFHYLRNAPERILYFIMIYQIGEDKNYWSYVVFVKIIDLM